VKRPYCGYKGDFKGHKSWSFGFYEVERLEYLRRHGVFQLLLRSEPLKAGRRNLGSGLDLDLMLNRLLMARFIDA